MRGIIINPASASGRTAHRWERIVAEFERRGELVATRLTTGPGDAILQTRRLLDEGVRSLVVLGGDGTVGEVIAGCVESDGRAMRASDIDLSVIHQGTGGDFALSLGIPKTEDEAIAVALGDQRRRIDASVAFYHVDSQITALADIDDANPHLRIRGFASCANVGMSSDVVRMVRGRLKRVGNSGAFAVATVRCITRNRERIMSVHAGGSEVQRGNFVDIAVCTSKYMGGGMFVAPDARPDDGMFDVVMIGGASRFKLLRTFPKIYRGTHVHDPLVSIATCGEVTIDPHGGRADGVVLDGELVGVTPARFSVIPAALDVRVAATPTPTS